ncbi:hypothetical protein M9H77_06620 [Catharanthus roseus]|uniref:Uncharacterized protein n=1 Tax=Catharanthus roseus TaxID=4058 RepID=A0ACC0BSL9_CATRO|nr:hypothetical protein M9H77_06620 [Catharanthus roseus]
MGVCNRALVWCLAVVDYEMPELVFDDLVLGSGPCSWSPICGIACFFKFGREAALMCLDSLRLPSCARNPHTYSLVPRGMQTPYSAAFDLVARLGYYFTLLIGEYKDGGELIDEFSTIRRRISGDEDGTVEVQGDNNCFIHLRGRV